MPLPPHLAALLDRALKASVAGPLLLAGCTPAVDTSAFQAPACQQGSLTVEGLAPAAPVDFAALRLRGEGGGVPVTLSSTGTACATAGNGGACLEALASLVVDAGFHRVCSQGCYGYSLDTTAGDTVTALDSLAALKAFLGTIDRPQEALLLAFADGYDIACGLKERGAVQAVDGGYLVVGTVGFACGPGTSLRQALVAVSPDGQLSRQREVVLEEGRPDCMIGRRPAGLGPAQLGGGGGALARHFVQAARLEAAAVHAFVRLAEELKAHHAPPGLRQRALVAAGDEVRHTVLARALAEGLGGTPELPRVRARALRPLAAVARENATEGCVRETFGALLAHRQADRARDPRLAARLRVLAEEETRHAVLSWEVHEWALTRLGRRVRLGLRAAQARAGRALVAEQGRPVSPELVEELGLPPAEEAVALARDFVAGLPAA